MSQKVAGHLLNSRVYVSVGCVYVAGRLMEDMRGTHHHGESRDLSHQSITTSWLEQLEYCERTDTTIITTRNSIYYTHGNLIQTDLQSDATVVTGKLEMHNMLVALLNVQDDEAND